MKQVTISLKGVYKASECTDINDVDFAIAALQNIYWFVLDARHTPATRRRIVSLEKRRNELILKR